MLKQQELRKKEDDNRQGSLAAARGLTDSQLDN